MEETFKRLDRKLVYKGHIIDLYEDTIQVPNGNVVKWDFIGHKGAAAVVPVMDDGRILLVRQFRNAIDRYAWEVPAGGRNILADGSIEDYAITAFRELEEETGYRTEMENLTFLVRLKMAIAYCEEQIDVYVANHLKPSKQHLDEDEFINVKAFSLHEIEEKILSGEIQDAKTISCIMTYKAKMKL